MMPARTPAHDGPTRGMSLLEVLIAMSLLAIIGAGLASSLSSSIDAKENVERVSGRYHVIRLAMSRMVDELSMAYLTKHVSTLDPRSTSNFIGEPTRVDFIAFGRTPRMEDDRLSDQREISYFLGNDPVTGENALMRREQVVPDIEMEKGGLERAVLTGVRSIELAYFDNAKGDWTDKWDSITLYNGLLPTRVRIRLEIDDEAGVPVMFVTQSKLWMQRPLEF